MTSKNFELSMQSTSVKTQSLSTSEHLVTDLANILFGFFMDTSDLDLVWFWTASWSSGAVKDLSVVVVDSL